MAPQTKQNRGGHFATVSSEPDPISGRWIRSFALILTRPEAAWLLLGIGLVVTILAAMGAKRQLRLKDETRFFHRTEALHVALRQEYDRYVQVLRSTQALWDIHPPTGYVEWQRYVQGLDLSISFPGLHGIAYVERIPAHKLSAYEQEVRRREAGHPYAAEFQVHPRKSTPDHYVVRYIEPLATNRAALGYDIGSDPIRRQAADVARDTGMAALTQGIALVQAPQAPGVLLILPVYSVGQSTTTVAQRRAALIGWVDVAFVVEDLLRALPKADHEGVEVQIFDGEVVSSATQLAGRPLSRESGAAATRTSFERQVRLDWGNTYWTLRFQAGPAFAQGQWFSAPGYASAAGLGLCISLLVFGIARSLAITQQRAQAMAEGMTARLRLQHQAMASVKIGLFIQDATDNDGRIIYANPAFERITGHTLGQALGDDTRHLLRNGVHHRGMHPDGQPGFLCPQAPADAGERIVVREYRREGRQFWAEFRLLPVLNDNGTRTHFLGLVEDVTERKEAQRALQESQERFALAVQGTNDGIWDWNVATNEVYYSPRWKSMLGYEEREVENNFSGWEKLLHPEDRERARRAIQAYFSGESLTYELEHRLRHKDGSYRWILARGVAQWDARGKPIRMAGSHVDLTGRKLAEQQLRHAYEQLAQSQQTLKDTLQQLTLSHEQLQQTQRQLIQAAKMECVGTLAAGIAHEVKNPLQTILLGVDFLAYGLSSPTENQRLALEEMREAVGRANRIVKELLQLSADTAFELSEEDLNALLERCLRLLKTELAASRTKIVTRLQPDLLRVRLDAGKIEQVLLNVLINALQAMNQGGSLQVFTRSGQLGVDLHLNGTLSVPFRAGERLVVAEIQDNGPGIAAEHLSRIFDPFFTTKAKGKGTGLGLSIVKKIIDLHEGSVEVRNAPEGGAIVTVALKASEPDSSPGNSGA